MLFDTGPNITIQKRISFGCRKKNPSSQEANSERGRK